MGGTILSLVGELSPALQLLVIAGLFTILIIAACSRRAAINLVSFLYDLTRVGRRGFSQQPSGSGNDQQRNAGNANQGEACERPFLDA